jgi:hypothetical protein
MMYPTRKLNQFWLKSTFIRFLTNIAMEGSVPSTHIEIFVQGREGQRCYPSGLDVVSRHNY